jgi:hypothetical protein
MEVEKMTSTPWGASQSSQKYAPGIISYSTASHGGYHLSKTRQNEMPEALKNPGGWYEEDCEWCKVVVAFPQFFNPEHVIAAYDTLKHWCYEAYEKITGVTLRSGESHAKDEVLFFEKHKNNWIVISALTNKNDRSLVDVTAIIGGKRTVNMKTRNFIVSAADYDKRDHFGFMITNQREV